MVLLRESTTRGKERQGTTLTLSVRVCEVSVLYWCPLKRVDCIRIFRSRVHPNIK